MSTIFDGSPVYRGTYGDQARVALGTEGRVLIRSVDTMTEEAVTIAMKPQQAKALAAAIHRAAGIAEGVGDD